MKTLLLLRHAPKDKNGEIGREGYQVAFDQGETEKDAHAKLADAATNGERAKVQRKFTKLFFGPQKQNLQTARPYLEGLGYTPEIMPTVDGLGNDALFAQINTPEFKAAVAGGLPLFEALIKVHGDGQAMAWGELCRMALMKIFDTMDDGENAIGFFYGIPIMLAAYACDTKTSDVIGYDNLGEMEGLIFTTDDEGVPVLADKVGVGK